MKDFAASQVMSNEYSSLENFFKERDFLENLLRLKKKYKNKKVVLYCNGIYFDALVDSCDLKKYINVIGISDMRYERGQELFYKGFECIKPSNLKDSMAEVILICSPNPESIKKYLLENNICPQKTQISHILLEDKCFIKHLIQKITVGLQYLLLSKNILKTFKYMFLIPQDEFQTKLDYEKVLKKLKKKNKIKVLFVCEENQKWGYQFVYELMKNDDRFEILPVVLFPIVTKNRVEFTQNDNIEFFKKLDIAAIDGYDYSKNINKDIKSFEPDLVFYQQPWYLQGQNHPQKVSKFALTMMIPYGFTTLSPDSWGSDSVKKVYSTLWRFFSESPYHNSFYEKAANMKHKDNLVAVGCPKLDYYKTLVREEFEELWKDKKQTKKMRIIWAPHHSITGEGLAMANFQEHYLFFLDLAKEHNEYSFVLKPHPALRSTCISSGFMSEVDYDNYIKEWENLPNASVYTKGDYFDIFKSSNVLITDSSSFLAEYFPSEKPIVFLDKSTRAAFDRFGEELKKGFYKINEISELEPLLHKLLNEEQDPLKTLRLSIIKKEIFYPKNGVAEEIIKYLKDIIFNEKS